MTSRHRPRAVLAVLTLVIAACMGAVAVGPASAAPAGAPTAARGPNLIPLKLSPKPVLKPKVAGNGQAVVYDNCGTVRANLKNYAKKYAARHIHQVSCVTVTRGVTKGTAKTTAHAPALEGPMATSSLCTQSSNGTWIYDRFDECEQGGNIAETIIDVNTGAVTGTADFTINQDILLQPTSTIYTENDSITVVSATGTANVPGTVFFDAGCGSPCGVLSGGQYTASLTPSPGATINNIAFAFEDTPTTQAPDLFMNAYAFLFSVSTAIPVEVATWGNDINIRCDNQLGGQPAGCVFPDYTPALVLSVAQYGAGAVNVSVAESLIPGSPGWTTPLTRGDPANTTANRNAICDSTFIPASFVPNDSCDEYPFASSQQSGGALSLTGSACMEIIPINLAGTWYYENVNDYTGQPCERGHVPLPQNEDVGTPLITMINTNRVLIGDQYWVIPTN